MAEYAYLIRRLDRRPILVELEATIIDVNADSVESLGIDWSARPEVFEPLIELVLREVPNTLENIKG